LLESRRLVELAKFQVATFSDAMKLIQLSPISAKSLVLLEKSSKIESKFVC
jgi:hypothetical protein